MIGPLILMLVIFVDYIATRLPRLVSCSRESNEAATHCYPGRHCWIIRLACLKVWKQRIPRFSFCGKSSNSVGLKIHLRSHYKIIIPTSYQDLAVGQKCSGGTVPPII